MDHKLNPDMTSEEFSNLALSFSGSVSQPHFERTAFKVEGRRIFATLHQESKSANIILNLSEQELFCEMHQNIYPVPNKWGLKGWTTFDLNKLERGIVLEALSSAYQDVVKKGKPGTKKR